MDNESLLELKKINKKYGKNYVLRDVDFVLRKNEVHAVVGENGAGKSTLIKIISGVVRPEDGAEIWIDGELIKPGNPALLLEKGISVMYQEISVFSNLTVAENICIDHKIGGFLGKKKMYENARRILDDIGCSGINERRICADLSIAEQQLVLLARSVFFKAKIVIMDEPTSALSDKEVQILYETIHRLKKEVSVIYISHKLDEIYQLADRITVLRDGRVVASEKREQLPYSKLIQAMLGKTFHVAKYAKSNCHQGEQFRIEGFSKKEKYENISLHVEKGEILGIAGLIGSGRTELAQGIMGIDKPDKGSVFLEGKQVHIRNIRDAIKEKIFYLTEDRRKYGLFYEKSIKQNITSTDLRKFVKKFFLSERLEDEVSKEYMEYVNVKAVSREEKVNTLSGGNQQKVLFSRWIHSFPKVLIVDEPTAGVDIGAKSGIYSLLAGLAEQGVAILVISSDLNEILTVSDRIVVMNRGRIVYEEKNGDSNPGELLDKMIKG